MKVQLKDDSVQLAADSKKLAADDCVGEYIGVTKLTAAAAAQVFRELEVLRDLGLTHEYYEHAYHRLTGRDQVRFGIVDVHDCTVTEFLDRHEAPITRFVLLDHMDWMSSYYPGALIEEWTGIIERAAPCARVLLRSAHARPPFLEWVRVGRHGRSLHEVIEFDRDLAARLQREDRVHTYSGFLVGTIPK